MIHQRSPSVLCFEATADPPEKLSQPLPLNLIQYSNDGDTQLVSDWVDWPLDTWDLGYLTSQVPPSGHREKLQCYVTMIWEWLTQWVEQGSNPFIHAALYRTRLPPCVQDAYTALSSYIHKKQSNEQMIFRILEDRAKQLIDTKGIFTNVSDQPDKDHDSLNSVEHLARVQSLLIYQIIGLFDGDIRLRHLAETQRPILDDWVREMAMSGGSMDMCAPDQLYEYASVDQDNLHWYSWIVAESIQRTWMMASGIHVIYLMMQQGVTTPCLGSVVFTTRTGIWEAPSAVAWSKLCLERSSGLIQMAEADRLFAEAAPEDVNDFTKVFLEATFGIERMERWVGRSKGQG